MAPPRRGLKEVKYEQKRFDIEVIGGQNDFEEHLLVNGDKFLIPFRNISGSLARLIRRGFVTRWKRIGLMVITVLENLYYVAKGRWASVSLSQSLQKCGESVPFSEQGRSH